MRLVVDIEIKDGKLYLPVQSDAENVSLEMIDDCERIYFDPIPLTDKLCLEYDGYGWEVKIKEN